MPARNSASNLPECASFSIPLWYVARTGGFLERIAWREITQLGYEAFCPVERVNDRLQPVFPRYLFVRFNIVADQWRLLLAVRGVASFVSFRPDGRLPAPIDDRIITHTKALLDATGMLVQKPKTKLGKTFAVVNPNSPLQHWSGICTMDAKQRVRLLLDFLGECAKSNLMQPI